MPTYTSTRAANVYVKGPDRNVQLYPGENEYDFYLKIIPTDVTLTDHDPQVNPYLLLTEVTSVPQAGLAVYAYDTIIILNATDAACVIYANNDDDNTLSISAGATLTITNGQLWGLLTIDSMGTGTVSIWGVIND
jgi:hypothetical protein